MTSNRSVPTHILLPHIVYQDVGKGIVWLTDVFGFREHYRYGEPGEPNGAQMYLGNAWIMLRKARQGEASPSQVGYATQSLTVFVEDVDAHFEKAKAAGAKIVEELNETAYGERQYGAEDLDGHHWLFSRHARNVSPEEWGATISQPAPMGTQISPMLAVSDARAAIEFYRAAFGAEVLWDLDGAIAGLSVGGARLFLADESPPHGTRGPASVGCTTVRIELFVDDPVAVHKRAVAAGAIARSPVREHQHATRGPQSIKRMLQGAVADPFGHIWLIGKILEQ